MPAPSTDAAPEPPDAGTTTDAPPPEPSTPPDPIPRKRPSARLRVNVIPWAEVTLDGRSLGRTPVDEKIRPGPHRLQLYNSDLSQTKTRSIDAPAGGEVSIETW